MKKILSKLSIFSTILILLSSFVLPRTIFAKPARDLTLNPQNFTLTIMHTNDSHARVEQRPKLATAVHEVRSQSPDAILVDAGDVFSAGTPYFEKYLGLADLWFMNDIHYDAMTFGNHEFDKGSEVLSNFIKQMTFPMVSANIYLKHDPYLLPLYINEISYNPVGGNIYPAIVKQVNGEKVGIFGLTAYSFPPVGFYDPYSKASATVAALQSQGINKIIVLSHLGFDSDQKLATSVNGIDVIVGGHSHSTVLEKPFVVNKIEPTIIVHAGIWLSSLGLLNVTFNPQGVAIAQDGKLLNLNNYAPDPVEQAKVMEFKAGLSSTN